jgi:hypothetical protein
VTTGQPSEPENDSRLLWFEQADGSTALMPADHEDRVATLATRLGTATDTKAAVLVLLEVRCDDGLDANYRRMVMVQAIDQLFQALLRGATPFEVVHVGSRLPALINSAKAALGRDFLSGSRD